MTVPLLDLRRQYGPLKGELLAALEAVAEFVGSPHAVGVSSGTDAELILLMALEIGPGDAVLTSPYTFFATASGIARLGARPVFVDIDPGTCNLDPERLADALERTPNVKAIIPVHLFGQCAEMEAILALGKKHGIAVLEDAAQALGARHPLGAAGAIGEAGWYSFYPTKNLGAFGDAGMVVCRDRALAVKLRALRNHGMETRYFHRWLGGNFRIDALQAAVLHVKLSYLDRWSAGRRDRAAFYRQELRGPVWMGA